MEIEYRKKKPICPVLESLASSISNSVINVSTLFKKKKKSYSAFLSLHLNGDGEVEE